MERVLEMNWTVWVGGSEMTDYPVSLGTAEIISELYLNLGYDDVEIEQIEL